MCVIHKTNICEDMSKGVKTSLKKHLIDEKGAKAIQVTRLDF